MSTTTQPTRIRRADGVIQRYHVSRTQPSDVSADDIIADSEAAKATAREALSRLNTRNSSDSLRGDYLALANGTMSENPEERKARELRERRDARGLNPVEISFSATGLEMTRSGHNSAGLNFYDSAEASVREAIGVTHPSSTGHDHWVSFWGLDLSATKAETIRDAMISRGWAKTQIKEEAINDVDFS